MVPLTGPFRGVGFVDASSLVRAQAVLRSVCPHKQTAEERGETPRGKWMRVRCTDCDDCLSLDYPMKGAVHRGAPDS